MIQIKGKQPLNEGIVSPSGQTALGNHGLYHPRAEALIVEQRSLPDRNLVLVVDDDPSILKSVARLLRQLGYASKLFRSSKDFANHDDFDGAVCVFLDIDLGDGSGIELRQRLKASNISVPIIYMTGNDSPAVREAAHRSGCLAYLTKPFSAGVLAANLRLASGSFA